MIAFRFLTGDEARFLERLANHMVPADELGPCACDLGVLRYIDQALCTNWAHGERQYLQGPWVVGLPSQGYQLPHTPAQLFRLGTAMAIALSTRCHGFGDSERVSPDQVEALLHALRRGSPTEPEAPPTEYFALLHNLILEGVFADPKYGGNAGGAGWKLIGFPGPGRGFRHESAGKSPHPMTQRGGI